MITLIMLLLLALFVSCNQEQHSDTVQTDGGPTETERDQETPSKAEGSVQETVGETQTEESTVGETGTEESVQETVGETETETEASVQETGGETEPEESTTVQDQAIVDGAYLESFNALQYGSSESSGLLTDQKNEFSYSNYDYQDEVDAKTVKIEVHGIEYELAYQKTSDGPLYRDTIHKYSDGRRDQWFNAETGKCIYFSDLSKRDYSDAKILSVEEQWEIAYDFLDSQVTNPEQFQIVRETQDPQAGFLVVWFARMINGIETYETVAVWVAKDGFICVYQLNHVNEMSNVLPVPNEILERVNYFLENKAKSMCSSIKKKGYETTYKTEINKLVRLDDGSLAFDCYIGVNAKEPDGNILSDGAWFIIKITEPFTVHEVWTGDGD